ncbi:membrane protein insertion efficiency factor YidD [Mannheimia varigena]|uniref:membrane protein insertion efficiency factor YidD n=1 Tax=Mannheimia varigena TaxID=85404 RepID=UPI00110600A4|nr:membrane protein insertion efficiency factor YidD [Mannheimia varigena]TLU74929.1 membrane protein insertion efficiency factor YidD [Mannheimia varigena]
MGKTYPPEQKANSKQSSEQPISKPKRISLLARLLLLPIYFYRYAISPLIGPRCRFYPTCSTYAVEAIKIHGAIKGGYLAFKRILRCNPMSEGGEDPVPPRERKCCKCERNEK